MLHGVRLSHAERVLEPLPLTKLELARYYDSVGEQLLPHVRARPLTLLRWQPLAPGEQRSDKGGVYLKHHRAWGPEVLRRVRIQEQRKVGEYLVVDDLAGLVGLVQMDVLELHTWNSTAERLETPDRVVFDLDPGPGVSWSDVVAAARDFRALLRGLELESWVKTTGGKGLHLVVPIVPEHDHATCLEFSRTLAFTLAEREPARFVASVPKAQREGRILIDYLRNARGNTSVAAYSVRARPNATVSVPIAWDELSPRRKNDHFTTQRVVRRLARLGADPWEGYFASRQRLFGKAERL